MRTAGKRVGSSGQSMVEYMLLVTAILLALIAAVATVIRPATENTITQSGGVINKAATKLQGVVQ